MGTRLRVASKILECLQDRKAAIASCMLFLEELHNLPAIGETFSTHFKGGIKSLVYKDSRLENVMSVISLNLDVSEFIARFSGELPNIATWPRIHLSTSGETIHPLVIDPFAVVDVYSMAPHLVNSMRSVTSKFIMAFIVIPMTVVSLGLQTRFRTPLALQDEVSCPSKVEMVREAFTKNRARVWRIINISPSEIFRYYC